MKDFQLVGESRDGFEANNTEIRPGLWARKQPWNAVKNWIKNFGKTLFEVNFAPPFNKSAMSVTRLKRKNRKDKAKSAVRRQTLKIQNFKPVMKNIDIEEIKKEFDSKGSKKA